MVGLRLGGRHCVVVGGGDEAVRRATNLADAGAQVTVVAAEPSGALTHLARQLGLEVLRRELSDKDLDGAWLVVQTERDAALAARLGAACRQRQIFFCAVDQPEPSSFSHVATLRSGPVTIAISSSGRAPALIRKLRDELSRLLDASGFAAFAERIAQLREQTPRSKRRELLARAVEPLRFEGSLRVPPPDIPLDQ